MEKLIENEKYESDFLVIDRKEEISLKRFSTKSNVKLVFFSSHTPCKYFSFDFSGNRGRNSEKPC